MGGEVVKDLLKKIDLDLENKEFEKVLQTQLLKLTRTKIIKRLKVVESILRSQTTSLSGS